MATAALGLVVLLCVGGAIYGPAMVAPAQVRAERQLLLQDRVVDGTAPAARALAEGRGPLGGRPAARLGLRVEKMFWGENPVGYRFGGVLLLLLLGVTVAAMLLRLGVRAPVAWACACLAVAYPGVVESGLWLGARGELVACLVAAVSSLAAVAAWRTDVGEQWDGAGGMGLVLLAAGLGCVATAFSPVGALAAVVLGALAIAPDVRGRLAYVIGALIVAAALFIASRSTLVVVPPAVAEAAGAGVRDLLAAIAEARGAGGPWTALATLGPIALMVLVARRASARGRLALALGGLVGLPWLLLSGTSGLLPAVVVSTILVGLVLGSPRSDARWPGLLAVALALVAIWMAAIESRRYLEPASIYGAEIARHPRNDTARILRARQLAFDGDLVGAVTCLREGARADAPADELALEEARIRTERAAERQASGAGAAESTDDLARARELLDRFLAGHQGRSRIDALLVRSRVNLLAQPAQLRDALIDLTDARNLLPARDERAFDLYLLLGHVRSALAYDAEARAAYEQCIAIDPRSFEACYHYGNFLTSLADTEERDGDMQAAERLRARAASLLSTAYAAPGLDRQGNLARLLVAQLGGNLGKIGLTDEARRWLERGMASWPDDPVILFNHALTLLGSPATVVKAETQMLRAVELAKARGMGEATYYRAILAEHLVQRGNTMLKSNAKEEAERLATLAVQVRPDFFAARLLVADVHFAYNRFSEAIAAYDEASAVETDPAGLYVAMVKRTHAVLQRGKAKSLLMVQLKRLAREEPESQDRICARYEIARAEAIADLEKFLELLPEDDKAEGARMQLGNLRKATCQGDEGEPTVADPQATALLREATARARGYWEQGKERFDAGEFAEAEALFTKAMSSFRGDPAYHFWRGRARALQTGLAEDAIRDFETTLRMDLGMVQAFFYLGDLYARTPTDPEHAAARLAKARENLEFFLQLSEPTSPLRARAQALLLDMRDR